MKSIRLPLALSLSLVAATPSLAQDALANRFTMQKTENGFVRMDTQTGEMSMCIEKDDRIVCSMAADERRAYEETLANLSDRISALEKKAGVDAGLEPSMIAPPEARLPDDAEIDQALGMMEKVMKRFFGMVEELRKDQDKTDDGVQPLPNRT